MDIATRFDAKEAEPRIYKLWEEAKAFRADPSSPKEPFTIVIPPPNVTGALHLGHALNNSLQDILTRWKRMDGFEALYLPGTDHAGIGTQAVVEKRLLEDEKKSRHDLGREEFLKRVWAWKETYGNTILMQLRRLGCSCDWSRTRFTMDEAYSRAVKFTFVALWKKGLLYRGKRVINWCPRCLTALSDLEVKTKDEGEPGRLWHIKYPVKSEPGKFVIVATTRPETMLGDTAVAVNSKDPRWSWAHGKTLVLPLMNREIPVIKDDVLVEAGFGTGAVKVTPAHDFNDYECGQRNKLPAINVMEPDARINKEGGKYAGLTRAKAREAVVADLEALGLIEKIEDYPVKLGRCDRCNAVVEPYLSDQWFCSMKDLAAPAIAAVKRGDVKFVPERWSKVYLDWMETIRDWCVSRQLWWGHQIPIWHCACGELTGALEAPTACPKCKGTSLRQDEDVLDTWFSSALWPFATLGWPAETPDLGKFYPTQVLVTSRDIINLWVARMIMTGLEFRGRKPFSDVIIHATLMDDKGERQSKGKGTGVDPLEKIDKYGADALRFALAWLTTGTQDIRFGSKMSEERIEMARNFVTKLWNAARFVMTKAWTSEAKAPAAKSLAAPERWILSRLNDVIAGVTASLEAYDFGPAAQQLYTFVWDELCSWYLELTKNRLDDGNVKAVLAHVLEASLRLLHPFCPFVTEEIWQVQRQMGAKRDALLMKAPWPAADRTRHDETLERGMELVFETVIAVRKARNEYRVPPVEALDAAVSVKDEAAASLLRGCANEVKLLGNLREFGIGVGLARPKGMQPAVAEHLTTYVNLGTHFDPAAEKAKKTKERAETVEAITRAEKQLSNEAFRKNKPDLAAEIDEKLAALKERLAEIDRAMVSL